MPENKQNEMSELISQKVSDLQQSMDGVSSSITDIQDQLKDMQKNMNEMYVSIVGDKKFGHTGLVNRVEELESTKKKWEHKVFWMYGYVFGAGTLITIFIEFIKTRFK